MNFKKKHLEIKMLIHLIYFVLSLNQHLPEVSARQHASCLDQQLDHDSDRFLEMPGWCPIEIATTYGGENQFYTIFSWVCAGLQGFVKQVIPECTTVQQGETVDNTADQTFLN